MSVASQTYAARIPAFANPAAKKLLETMERKQSNLCVSVDVTKKEDLLQVVRTVAKDVCMVKTHIDIVEDFDLDLTRQLTQLSEENDFVIFEDRKFADIGNTVSLQYASGVHKIASWSHITNAHLVPGPGIITGLAEVGVPLQRGLLLLAEMSSKGNLAGGEYGQKCVQAARDDTTGFTCGFIAMDRIDEKVPLAADQPHRDFLVLTPGVGLDVKGDAKGQQYRTPDEVIRQSGCDVIIVGRGIYGPLLKDGNTQESFKIVQEQAARYKEAGWKAYLQRTGLITNGILTQDKRALTPGASENAMSPAKRRRLFVPSPASTSTTSAAATMTNGASGSNITLDGDAALASQLAAAEASASTRSYTLRHRVKAEPMDDVAILPDTTNRRASTRSIKTEAVTPVKQSLKDEDDNDDAKDSKSIKKGKQKKETKPKASPFDVSPQKTTSKPIKLELEPHEVKPAPKRWEAQLAVLSKQRKRIIAPVDEMGCDENRTDPNRLSGSESSEDQAKRERFTILVSLMLSSQTKDEVTAQAVRNLQSSLTHGCSMQGILEAMDEEISTAIAKVGFWRRKTGYLKSAALLLSTKFGGDVPQDIDELCSLPGVGPKMAFLTLQSAWKINLGIGVDVHVHRLANRLGWAKTKDPEGTRLTLQSWLPKELHTTINKTLVGFGQVICVPVGPRCDLCDLGSRRLCPSYRKVDAASIASRKQVVLLPEEGEGEAEVKVEGPDGVGKIVVETEEGEGEGENVGEGRGDLSW